MRGTRRRAARRKSSTQVIVFRAGRGAPAGCGNGRDDTMPCSAVHMPGHAALGLLGPVVSRAFTPGYQFRVIPDPASAGLHHCCELATSSRETGGFVPPNMAFAQIGRAHV